MALLTTDELRADALFRAGEPQSSSSTFWTQSLVYMNRVMRQLALGGGIAVGRDLATVAGIYAQAVTIPMTDFWWLRKRGIITTTAADTAKLATATQGSATVTLDSAPSENVEGWRLQINNLPTVVEVVEHEGTTLTIDGPWPEDDQSGGSSVLFKADYDLPPDFLRWASRPYPHSTFSRPINVSSVNQQILDYPWSSTTQGRPTRAYQVDDQTVRINTYDTRPYRLEFYYIALPDDLLVGSTPPVPVLHRLVLASGTAMLILHDKDDSRAMTLASEYREGVMRMIQEHRKSISGGSNTFGVIKPRPRGFLQRAPQPMGELYLV